VISRGRLNGTVSRLGNPVIHALRAPLHTGGLCDTAAKATRSFETLAEENSHIAKTAVGCIGRVTSV
jgi:hypothetical protein